MGDESRDLSGKIGLNLDDFKSGVEELKRQLKLIDSGFKSVSSGMDDWSATSEGLETRIETLNEKIRVQQNIVDADTAALQRAIEAHGATSVQAEILQTKVNNATAELNKEKLELDNTKEALANFGKESEDVGKTTDDTKISFTEFNQGIELVKKGLAAAQKVYDDTVGATIKLGEETKNLQNITGDTAEASSTFLGVMGDLGIGADQLTRILDIAIKKGYQPNIEGMQQLRAEYQAIQDPIAQTKWLLDTFGRSGAQLAEYFKATDVELAQLADGVKSAGIVMNQNGVDSAHNLSIELAQLNDRWTGIKVSIGEFAVPALTNIIDWLNLSKKAVDDSDTAWMNWVPGLNVAHSIWALIRGDFDKMPDSIDHVKQGVDNLADEYTGKATPAQLLLGQQVAYTADQLTALNIAAHDAIGVEFPGLIYQADTLKPKIEDLAQDTKDFNTNLGTLKEYMSTGLTDASNKYITTAQSLDAQWYQINADVVKFQNTKYRTPEQEAQLNNLLQQLKNVNGELKTNKNDQSLKDQAASIQKQIDLLEQIPGKTQAEIDANEANKKKLGEINAQIDQNQKDYDKAQKTIIFNMLETVAAAEAAADPKNAAKIMAGLSGIATAWGLIDTTTETTMQNTQKAFDAWMQSDGKKSFDDFYREYMGMSDKTITITNRMITEQVYYSNTANQPDTNNGANNRGAHTEGDFAYLGYIWHWNGSSWVTIPGGIGAKASGGQVFAGVPYLVGENGPEPFVPAVNGTIFPTTSIGSFTSVMKQFLSGLNQAMPNLSQNINQLVPGFSASHSAPGKAPVTVYVTASVANTMDMHTMALRIAQEIQRVQR